MRNILCALCCLIASLCFAQEEGFNQDFGYRGDLFINNKEKALDEHYSNIRSMCVLPDGKVLLASRYTLSSEYMGIKFAYSVMKLNQNGSIDSSFGLNGVKIITPVNGVSFNSMQVQQDGKIILAGGSFPNIVRLLPNGDLDSSFNSKALKNRGSVITSDVQLHRLLVVDNNSYKVIGKQDFGGQGRFVTFRVTGNGEVDTTYGKSGFFKGIYVSGSITDFEVMDAVEHSNHYTTVMASRQGNDGKHAIFSMRIHRDGITDSTYGTNGTKDYPQLPSFKLIKTIGAANDKYYVLGKNLAQGDSSFIYKFNYNGNVDSTFGINGVHVLKAGNENINAFDIELTADSLLVVNGLADNTKAVLRVTSNGKKDVTFGLDGATKITTPGFGWSSIASGGGLFYVYGAYRDSAQFQVWSFKNDGMLDVGYGNGGVTRLTHGGTSDKVMKVVKLSNGGFLVGGTMQGLTESGTHRFFRKYHSDGTPDKDFGESGIVIELETFSGAINEMAVLPGDGFLVAGTMITAGDIKKYHANGSVDTNFGNNGIFSISTSDNLHFNMGRIAVQADGKIVFSGYSRSKEIFVGRITADGKKDVAFGTDGMVLFGEDKNKYAKAITITPENNILFTAHYWDGNGSVSYELMQLKSSGTIDTLFGQKGLVKKQGYNSGNYYQPNDILVQQDGNILVVSLGAITRYLPNGKIDLSFASGGAQQIVRVYKALMQEDGRILVVGSAKEPLYDESTRLFTTRLKGNGNIDSSFGINGYLFRDGYEAIHLEYSPTWEIDPEFITPALLEKVAPETYISGGSVKYKSIDGLLGKLQIKEKFPAKSLSLTQESTILNCPQIKLQWHTTEESEAAYFTVEKSSDSISFVPLGQVKAQNNHSEASYSFNDTIADTLTYYYRVRLWGQSGSYSTSNTIRQKREGTTFTTLEYLHLTYDSTPGRNKHILSFNVINQNNVDSIVVQRMVSGQAYVNYATITPRAAADTVEYTFTDTSLSYNKFYYYRILFAGNSCTQLLSNEVSNKTMIDPYLPKPEIGSLPASICSSMELQKVKILNPPATALIKLKQSNDSLLYYNSADSTFQYFASTTGLNKLTITFENAHNKTSTEVSFTVIQLPSAGPIPVKSGLTLTAPIDANFYHWYLNNAILGGATSKEMEITENGNYSYTYSLNGCISPMSPVLNYIRPIPIDSSNVVEVINLYPNPNKGKVFLSGLHPHDIYTIQIVSLSGAVVKEIQRKGSEMPPYIDVSGLDVGVYFVKFYNITNNRLLTAHRIQVIK